MNIITFLLVGLVTGWVASSLIMGHGMGTIRNIVIGVIGALVGGFVFDIFGIAIYGFWGSVLMSTIGAVLFLYVVGIFSKHKYSER